MGMGFMFDIFPILFMVVFILILGVILISLGRGVSQWHKNNQSPVLTVQAEVVTKRPMCAITITIRAMSAPCIPPAAPSITLPSRWRAAIEWSFMCPGTSTGCWWRVTTEG